MNRPEWIERAAAVPLAEVLAALGITLGRELALSRCPACGWRASGKDNRKCRLRSPAGEWIWHCFACGQGGDGIQAVRLVHRGDWSAVRDFYNSHGWCGTTPRTVPVAPVMAPSILPPPTGVAWPSAQSVLLFSRLLVPAVQDEGVMAWLRYRLGDRDDAARRASHFVMALPLGAVGPEWARIGSRTWADAGYRAIFGLWDGDGVLRSVRARRVSRGAGPKAVPATGCKAGGLVLANPAAVAMLRREGRPQVVRIVEGEPRFLVHCLSGDAVLGIYSGSWTPQHAAAVPTGATVIVETDADDRNGAGDRYYEMVRAALASRCTMHRYAPPSGEVMAP
jgi:hypothetical protein